ncbi:hypothetical protein ACWEQL_36140 [Kitasatospora sp. NPDC004240]
MVERRWEYAPAGTLPGLLQRGRGLGARMAAEDRSAAAELVYGCVRWEWRGDVADRRALYLARLLRDLELPLGPVTGLLGGADEGARRRAAEVLGLLALGGSQEAGEALRGHGPDAPEPPSAPDPAPARCAGEAASGGRGGEGVVAGWSAELERCWVEQRWCGPAGLARGLAGAGAADVGAAGPGAVSLLRRFWLWTPHSHERAAYLEALAVLGPAGLGEVYVECLWDCEADSRLLAAGRAPDGPQVRERLAYLRDDPLEEPAVRAAARERLAALTG